MDSNKYTFDFMIPQGPTGSTGPQGTQGIMGPTGPTGPAGTKGLKAYGGRYNNSPTVLNLQANTPTKLPLLNFMPPQRINYTGDTKTIIETEGTYEIAYKLIASTKKDTVLTVVVQENGVDNSATKNVEILYINESLTFSTDIINTFPAQTELELIITSKETAEITIGYNATLTVKKLN